MSYTDTRIGLLPLDLQDLITEMALEPIILIQRVVHATNPLQQPADRGHEHLRHRATSGQLLVQAVVEVVEGAGLAIIELAHVREEIQPLLACFLSSTSASHMASTAVRYLTLPTSTVPPQRTSVEVTDSLLCPPELELVARVSRPLYLFV